MYKTKYDSKYKYPIIFIKKKKYKTKQKPKIGGLKVLIIKTSI